MNSITSTFEELFGYEPDAEKIALLIDQWGKTQVLDTLNYLKITGLRAARDPSTANPYGLIFSMCRKWARIQVQR